MKRIVFCAVLIMAMLSVPAFADKIEGTWTGVGQALGRSSSVSASFDGQGGFTAFGLGMTVVGSYTLYEDSVTLTADNMSMSFAYSSDGSVESLTGSTTYMGISGSITLTRDAAVSVADIVVEEEQSDVRIEDVYAAWSYSDKMSYSLSLYKSGYAMLIISDEEAADERLVSELDKMTTSEEPVSIADFVHAVRNNSTDSQACPALYSVNGGLITLRFLDEGFSKAPESIFKPMWDAEKNSVAIFYRIKSDGMYIYNSEGEAICFKASSLSNDWPDDEGFLQYKPTSMGDRGDNVKFLQDALIASGYLSDNADGAFGKKTRAAVENLQRENGLETTGIADGAVWSVLLGW